MSELDANIFYSRQARHRSRFYFHLAGVISDQASRAASAVVRYRVDDHSRRREIRRHFISLSSYESVIKTRLYDYTIQRLGLHRV